MCYYSNSPTATALSRMFVFFLVFLYLCPVCFLEILSQKLHVNAPFLEAVLYINYFVFYYTSATCTTTTVL